MHFNHKPGEQMQVDFAGDKLHYVDRDTGEVILCEVLVCVLPLERICAVLNLGYVYSF